LSAREEGLCLAKTVAAAAAVGVGLRVKLSLR